MRNRDSPTQLLNRKASAILVYFSGHLAAKGDGNIENLESRVIEQCLGLSKSIVSCELALGWAIVTYGLEKLLVSLIR